MQNLNRTKAVRMICAIVLLRTVLAGVRDSPTSTSEHHIEALEASHTYKIKISAGQEKQFFFAFKEANQSTISLDIISTGSFELCVLNLSKHCVSAPQRFQMKSNALKLNVKDLSYGIKVRNSSPKTKIKLHLSFHFDQELCHKLETSILHRTQLSHTNCFSFEITKIADAVIFVGKERFRNLQYEISLCGANISIGTRQDQAQFFIKQSQLREKCTSKTTPMELTIKIIDRQIVSQGEKKVNQKCDSWINLGLQYPKQGIVLPDGIAFQSSKEYLVGNQKTFYYELINFKNTSINVITEAKIEIFAKVVEQNQKNSTNPTRDFFDFSSKSGEVFTYFRPYLMISQQQLDAFSCQDCFLVVSVIFPAETPETFSIEITQQVSALTNGMMKHHFLLAGSMAYYQYIPKTDTVVSYELADNNRKCAQFYLSTVQLPGPSNSLEQSVNNRIIYKSKSKTVYYIGVKANSDCAYSLVATDSSNELTTLEKGRFGYLNLAKGQFKYFLINTQVSRYIKLLSLHVYGKVEIYINKTTINSIKQFSSSNNNISMFSRKGQFMNRLILTNKDDLYCDHCLYIVAVVALKVTESTLFYGDQLTPIPIHDKIINDMILDKGDKVQGQYYGELRFDLQVKIHSGKLKLNIKNAENHYEAFYEEAEVIQTTLVDLGKKKGLLQILFGLFDSSPITVSFEALQNNTVYSARFIDSSSTTTPITGQSDDDPTPTSQKPKPQSSKNLNVEAGQSMQFPLEPMEQICINGYLKDKSQRFLISSYIDEKEKLSGLSFRLEASGKELAYKTEIIQNIMTLSVPSLANYYISKGIGYKLCIKANVTQTFWVTFIQSQDFALLPPEVDIVVRDEYTFVTHTQAPLIIDIFECKGKSSIAYDQKRQQLKRKQNHSLDIIGIQNQPHAVRINTFATTFYQINASLAIVRWFPFIIDKGIGTGYLDFAIGKLQYQSGIFGVTLKWQSLYKERQTQSSISSIDITLYISSSSSDLQSGSQCQAFLQSDTWQIKNFIDPLAAKELNKAFSYTFSKEELVDRFGANINLFSTVVIDLSLLPANRHDQGDDGERYRFIYPEVQIPGQIISKGYIASMSFTQFVIVGILGFIALVICTYFLLSKILPLLGILKNRYLVEEDQHQGDPVQNKVVSEGQNDLIVPPSSDRGGVEKFNSMMNEDEQES